MSVDPQQAEAVFTAALARPLAERAAFVQGAAMNDAELRARVESLLQAHDGLGTFLDLPTQQAPTLEAIHEGPGSRIGRYKLLQLIGEGGFGSVFMAEQEEPVRRRVALKIVKLGMDTRQVIARFEAERQALALMDHPNIAKVFDAGATDTGRPYFVMELVKGVPITEYCDKNNLGTREREELFVSVCSAVQHAHQKGVIHRDIKPSNVLVTLHDGKPVPKVIDFGIAKATSQRLTEKTLFTEFRQFVGTPAYTSPEQAEMSGLDVDTRSDIYSLGVLLYELLTGAMPFDSARLREAAYGEIQRIIREVEPPRPSVRLSTMGEALSIAAKQRSVDPAQLRKQISGDLDWIVMKCLEKDRGRRYDTANGLALDIRRHLDSEPVTARPASAPYRLRKFARRNKTGVAAAGLVSAALLLGIMGTTIGFVREHKALGLVERERNGAEGEARRAAAAEKQATEGLRRAEQLLKQVTEARTDAGKQAKRAAAAGEFMKSLLAAADPKTKGNGRAVKVVDLLDAAAKQAPIRFKNQPELQWVAEQTLGSTYAGLDLNAEALAHLSNADTLAAKLDPESEDAIATRYEMCCVLMNLSRREDASPIAQQSFELVKAKWPDSHLVADLADCLATLSLDSSGKDAAKAEALAREGLKWDQEHAYDPSAHAKRLWILYLTLRSQGKSEEAEQAKQQATALSKDLEPGRFSVADKGISALFLGEQEKFDEAEQVLRELVVDSASRLGESHSDTLAAMNSYAQVLLKNAQYDKLLKMRERIALARSGAGFPNSGTAAGLELLSLAYAHAYTGDIARARELAGQALRKLKDGRMSDFLIAEHWRTAVLRLGMGVEKQWKNPALRAQVWCALDEHMMRHPEDSKNLDVIPWDAIRFKLDRWQGAAGPLRPVFQGGLQELQAQGPLEEGSYTLTIDAPPSDHGTFHAGTWLTFARWDASLYRMEAMTYGGEGGMPRGWEQLKLRPPLAKRAPEALALCDAASAGTGLGLMTTSFIEVASATVRPPPGQYRLLLSSDDGARADLDGRRVIDSWVAKSSSIEGAVVEFDGGAHVLRIEYFQVDGPLKLWVRLEPVDAGTQVAGIPPIVTSFDRQVAVKSDDIKKAPFRVDRLMNRGLHYARYGHFAEAAEDFGAAMKFGPGEYDGYWNAAYAQFQLGNEKAYREICDKIIEGFATDRDHAKRERLARACALIPDVVDPNRLVQMLDHPSGPWDNLARGAALYRARDWDGAIGCLSKSLETDIGPYAAGGACYFLAMSHHQLQQEAQAREFMARGNQIADTSFPPSAGMGDMGPHNWVDWIFAIQARREAETLLGAKLPK